MKPTTKRIALIIAGALISGAALMAQGAASPTKSAVKAPAVQSQVKAPGTTKGATKSTSKARRTAKTAKASHRRHRRARRTAAPKVATPAK